MFKNRIYVLAACLALFYLAALGRLAYLQLWKGTYFREVQARNSRSEQLLPAPRGKITLRGGEIVAQDVPSLDLSVKVGQLKLERLKIDEVRQVRESYADPVKENFKTEAEYAAAFGLNKERRESGLQNLALRLVDDPWVQEVSLRAGRKKEEVAAGLFKAFDQVARKWATAKTEITILRGIDDASWTALRATQEDQFENTQALAAASINLDAPANTTQNNAIKGLFCTHSVQRVYPEGKFLSHVIGPIGDMSPDQMAQLREDGVLTDHLDARMKIWTELREELNDRQAEKLAGLLGTDPRTMDLPTLMTGLRRLDANQRRLAASFGLPDAVRWTAQPPRVLLGEAEKLWMLNTGDESMFRRSSSASFTDLRIGETGVECWYNQLLRGKHGLKYGLTLDEQPSSPGKTISFQSVPPDVMGFGPDALESDNARDTRPHEGSTLRLTIDNTWQHAVEDELKAQGHPAAMVVMDCQTGEILALASYPDFDPNLFAPPREGVERMNQLRAVLDDSEKPLLNRACSEQYPLGSIMKSLVAAVALEKGVTNENETLNCPGYIMLGKLKYHCDGNHQHGRVNITEALRRSCNVFFYQQGARVGVEELSVYAQRVGMGRRTGIDLPSEASGIIPDRAWRVKAFPNSPQDQSWSTGKDYHLAIGQGYMTATPLQAATLMATIANGGYAVTPHLNLDAPNTQGMSVGFSARTLAIVKEGLDECVNVGTPGARGTAYKAFHESGIGGPPVRVAGKTSTADVGSTGQTPHAWFAGFAPVDNPRIAFAVFVANSGHGGDIAAPIAARVIHKAWPK